MQKLSSPVLLESRIGGDRLLGCTWCLWILKLTKTLQLITSQTMAWYNNLNEVTVNAFSNEFRMKAQVRARVTETVATVKQRIYDDRFSKIRMNDHPCSTQTASKHTQPSIQQPVAFAIWLRLNVQREAVGWQQDFDRLRHQTGRQSASHRRRAQRDRYHIAYAVWTDIQDRACYGGMDSQEGEGGHTRFVRDSGWASDHL